MMLLAVIAALALASCTNEPSLMLLRAYDDPYDDIARAECFKKENTIYLSWREDAGADEYVLMRADDIMPYGFKEVYRGNGLEYEDTFNEAVTNERYLYRLDKRRGNRMFEGRELTRAVRAVEFGGADAYGSNDREESAVRLESDRLDVLPCWRFSDGALYTDVDWYYVVLEARRKATIVLEETTGGKSYAEGSPTPFRCIVAGGTEKELNNKSAFAIVNERDEVRKIPFRLYADTTQLFRLGAGCEVLSYTLSLKAITAYP